MTDLQAQQRAERLVDKWDPNDHLWSELVSLVAAELLAVQREAYCEALEDVANDWQSKGFRGHDEIQSVEVQAFLDTRHVHYAKAQAIRAVQEGGIDRLTTAEKLLHGVKDEIAALFPHPKDPSLNDAQRVCAANNPADAACLLKAMELLNEWRER